MSRSITFAKKVTKSLAAITNNLETLLADGYLTEKQCGLVVNTVFKTTDATDLLNRLEMEDDGAKLTFSRTPSLSLPSTPVSRVKSESPHTSKSIQTEMQSSLILQTPKSPSDATGAGTEDPVVVFKNRVLERGIKFSEASTSPTAVVVEPEVEDTTIVHPKPVTEDDDSGKTVKELEVEQPKSVAAKEDFVIIEAPREEPFIAQPDPAGEDEYTAVIQTHKEELSIDEPEAEDTTIVHPKPATEDEDTAVITPRTQSPDTASKFPKISPDFNKNAYGNHDNRSKQTTPTKPAQVVYGSSTPKSKSDEQARILKENQQKNPWNGFNIKASDKELARERERQLAAQPQYDPNTIMYLETYYPCTIVDGERQGGEDKKGPAEKRAIKGSDLDLSAGNEPTAQISSEAAKAPSSDLSIIENEVRKSVAIATTREDTNVQDMLPKNDRPTETAATSSARTAFNAQVQRPNSSNGPKTTLRTEPQIVRLMKEGPATAKRFQFKNTGAGGRNGVVGPTNHYRGCIIEARENRLGDGNTMLATERGDLLEIVEERSNHVTFLVKQTFGERKWGCINIFKCELSHAQFAATSVVRSPSPASTTSEKPAGNHPQGRVPQIARPV